MFGSLQVQRESAGTASHWNDQIPQHHSMGHEDEFEQAQTCVKLFEEKIYLVRIQEEPYPQTEPCHDRYPERRLP